MNLRIDMLYGINVQRPAGVVALDSMFSGVHIRETDLAQRPRFRVVKSHPRARRKRYTVQRVMEPCAFVIDGVWFVHPSIAGQLRKHLA